MSWALGIEIGLKAIGWIYSWFASEEEKEAWIQSAAETLQKKGWVRDKFVLELEQSRDDYLKEKVEKIRRERAEAKKKKEEQQQ